MQGNAEAGPSSITESLDHDSALSKSEYLTRQELLKRRASRLRRLAKCYGDHYWLLMEDVRRKHRDFIWKFGKDSFDNVVQAQNGVVLGGTVNNNVSMRNNRDKSGDDVSSNGKLGLGLGFGGGSFNRCSFPNCRCKAMALTNYCYSHILSDSKQVLYTGCQFAHKCFEGPILCGKPVLRSTVPALCPSHLKISEQNIRRALKKSGASTAASNKLASKFHLVLTEYVRLIQTRRRAMRVNNLATKGSTA